MGQVTPALEKKFGAGGDFVQLIKGWREDPGKFVRECFGVVPEPWQAQALEEIGRSDRLAVKSGHGVGKSAFLSWLIIWWLVTRYPAVIPCTANTATQLSDVLWREVDKWHRRMPEGLRSLLEVKADRVELVDDPKQCFAVARTARKETPEAFQGYHSENLLFIVDEASGVDDIIFEVGKGSMSTKGAKTVMTGNPTRTQGYFYNAFHLMRSFWKVMTVPCGESSQVSEQYIEECREEYGADSNLFRVRVLGEFPEEGDNIIIPLHMVESAVDRDIELVPGELRWGLDVARFGSDRTALAKRNGNHLLEPVKWWAGKDTMQVAGLVHHEYTTTRQKPEVILVDAIGIGAGVADRLKEVGLPAKAINVAEVPATGEKYMRLRDELWWAAKEWFATLQVRIPRDDRLIGELTLPTYNFTSGGKIKAESKDELRKRTSKSQSTLGKSPDIADAFVLTFAGGVWGNSKRKYKIKYPPNGIV